MFDKNIQNISILGNDNIVIQLSDLSIYKLNLDKDKNIINKNYILKNIFKNIEYTQNKVVDNFFIEKVLSINAFYKDENFLRHKNIIYLKSLKNNTYYYFDTFQADGNIHNIKTYPNLIENIKYEESVWTIRYKLPKVLKKNENILHKISCNYINSFNNKKEYWIINPISPTKCYFVKFISPPKKFFKSVIGYKKINYFKEEISNNQPKIFKYSNNRNCIIWELNELIQGIKYKIEWEW